MLGGAVVGCGHQQLGDGKLDKERMNESSGEEKVEEKEGGDSGPRGKDGPYDPGVCRNTRTPPAVQSGDAAPASRIRKRRAPMVQSLFPGCWDAREST
jgi:hypothetical protein